MKHSALLRFKLTSCLWLALAVASSTQLPAADAPATASTPAPAAATTAGTATSTTAPAATPAAPTATTAAASDAPKVNTAIVPAPQRGANYQTVHQKLVEQAKAGGIDVLFVGDSITDFWIGVSSGRATGKDVWDKNFAPLKAADFGYNADRTQNVLWRLQNGEGQGFSPKAIVLMIGTNNVGVLTRANPTRGTPAQGVRNSTPEAVEGVTAVVKELRKDFPTAKILLLSIFPRDDDDLAKAQIPQVNKEIAKLDDQQHVFYLDITKNFTGPDGNILPDAFGSDKLHPTAKGYQIWADAIKDPLANLLK